MNLKKYYFNIKNRIKALKGTPHSIAIGMAAGIFAAFTPTFPCQTLVAIALAVILKGNKPSAVIGSFLSNPVTIPIIYLESYKIGSFIMGKKAILNSAHIGIKEFFKKGAIDLAYATFLGGAVLGIIFGMIVYFITKKLFIRFYKTKRS